MLTKGRQNFPQITTIQNLRWGNQLSRKLCTWSIVIPPICKRPLSFKVVKYHFHSNCHLAFEQVPHLEWWAKRAEARNERGSERRSPSLSLSLSSLSCDLLRYPQMRPLSARNKGNRRHLHAGKKGWKTSFDAGWKYSCLMASIDGSTKLL